MTLAQAMRRSISKELNAEWSKYQVNVCDRAVRSRLNEKGTSFCKAKTKLFLTKKTQKKFIYSGAKNVWIGEIMNGEK